jgi:hypothetical protein
MVPDGQFLAVVISTDPLSETRLAWPWPGFLVAVHDCRIDYRNSFWNRFPSLLERSCSKEAVKMPGDPKECRQHAERCAELARLASTPEGRETFLSLQMTWIRLASELDQAGALIKAVQELEEERPVKAAE